MENKDAPRKRKTIQFWCCVPSCKCGYNPSKRNISFFTVPDPRKQKTVLQRQLAKKRLKLWSEAIGCEVQPGSRICEWHFLYGKPASMTSTRDVDWVPSRHLENSTRERWTVSEVDINAAKTIDQPHAEMDSADEMEPLVATEDEDAPEEEGDQQQDEETMDSDNDQQQDEESDAAEPETLVETVLESDNEEIEATDAGDTAVQSGEHVEEDESAAELSQEHTGKDQQDGNSSVECEMFEEIEPDEENADGGETIGIEREDHDETFVENFCGEVEIKEEEPEIEQEEEQSYLEDDPIMGMPVPIKYEDSDNDDVQPMVQIKDNTRKQGKKKQSSSDTETADEGDDCEVVLVTSPIGEHAYHASPAVPSRVQPKRKVTKKKTLPAAVSPYMARNVRNFLHTKNSTHTCLECQGQFFSVVQYLKHRKRHPKVKNFPYQCRYCPSRFRLHRDMLPHLLTHSKLEKFTCPMCPVQIYSAHKLVTHMQVHRSSPKENYYFKCVTCSVRFSKCKQLEDHNLVSHPKFVNGVPVHPPGRIHVTPKNRTRTVHVCFHCGKVEGTWPELLVHMRIHKGPLACTICLLSLKGSDEFAEHVVKVHKDMGELTYHQCKNPSCPREFISPRELKAHEATCVPLGGEYRCEICDQLYREVDHFITHMELHSMLSNELGHKMCPHCVFPTNDPGAFAAHLVNHHGYRDKVETLEKLYSEYLRQDEAEGTSEDDSDFGGPEKPNEAEQEKKARHIADDVVQVCERE
ncbi:zinc finger X-chromosomal protein isoform X3 [Aedes albopictus]|uniref:C2H2-type domain-containing protein n=1 Tax=Aedes albopictus TaxID=7160 RepID=A0ABM1ZC80_AEDAL